ncbi:SusC/RagA family TonB-linked outer membrane protein [Niastella caeni]|uniref:SusC/RagA family TonB-linked outer membrane protein n=2 Tax=Niastella caeni TaxID=2569763 RepID=A0A4S8HX58_9BACT|nr:SusC/RagA family TonB-linked outer membrane protein [Niastella caeni]
MLFKRIGKGARLLPVQTLLVMKLTTALIFFACLQVSATGSYGQKITLSVKNAPIEQVFEKLQQQAGYMFIFDSKEMQKAKKITVEVRNATVEQVLEICFKNQPLTYQVINKTIIVKPKSTQQGTDENEGIPPSPIVIKGVVMDENGHPLSGVSITVKGKKTGTQSNDKGEFSITVDDENTQLVFTYVGYEEARVNVRNAAIVSMKQTTNELAGVVVNALGFRERSDKQGSSNARIAATSVVRAGETGLLQNMGGKAAGVAITRSTGDPGAGASVKIRGQNTITGSSQPLVILDGIPVSNTEIQGFGSEAFGNGVAQQSRLNDINPNDIESIQILKGASAAALWGSRAANGVIVITTKKGKAGGLKITYNSAYSIDEINRKHELQSAYGQGDKGIYNPAAANSWGDKIANRSGAADVVNTSGAHFIGDKTGTIYYPVITKNSRETYNDKNFDGIFGKGHYWQNALSLSGGNERSRFFFSLENLAQKGIIRSSSDYNRSSIRLNSDHNLNKYFKVSNKATYISVSSERVQQNSNAAGLYLGMLRTSPDFDNTDYIGTYVNASGVQFRNRQRSYRRYLGDNVNPTYNNPYFTIYNQQNTSKVNRFVLSSEVSSNPFPWLELILRGGLDANYDNRNYFFPVGTAGDRVTGSFRSEKISEVEKNLDLIGKITREISTGLTGSLVLGGNINDRQREIQYVNATNFFDNTTLQNFIITSDVNTHAENEFRKIGSNRGYTTASLEYMDQFFVNLSGAVEAASTIKGSFFYPSADVAWQFSKIASLTNAGFLSFGKLRAAWGKVGVQPGAYNFVTVYQSGMYSTYDDVLATTNFGGGYMLSGNKGNANLKPEIKTEWEVGADLRFFNDRYSFSFSHYQNKIQDILLNIGLAPSSGFISQYKNAGTMTNKGFEADFKAGVIKTKDLDVQVFGNFSTNKNKVTSLNGSSSVDLTTGGVSSRAVQDYPMGVLWGTRALRDAKGGYALDGNGFLQINPSPGVIGDPNPDWRGGAGLSVSYKNIDLNVLFETAQGGQIAEGTKTVLYSFGMHADVSKEVTLTENLKNVNGTTFAAGTAVRGNIANFGAGNVLLDEAWYTSRGAGVGASSIRELFISDASWTRLRELSIGYSLNSQKFKKATKFSSLRFSVTGRNLFLWTQIKGFDPEVNQTGVSNGYGLEYFTNPSTRSLLFSITLNY